MCTYLGHLKIFFTAKKHTNKNSPCSEEKIGHSGSINYFCDLYTYIIVYTLYNEADVANHRSMKAVVWCK